MAKYRLHKHVIDEKQRKDYRDTTKGLWFYKRYFWHMYRTRELEETSVGDWHIEVRLRPEWSFAWRFKVGNAGSETPFDGHVILFGFAFYWGMTFGRKLAQRLTERPGHKWGHRDTWIWVHDGRIRVNFWWDDELRNNTRTKYRRNKSGKPKIFQGSGFNFSLLVNPVEIIWGPKKYSYEDIAVAADMVIGLPEGTYLADLTLQRCTLKRTHSKRVINVDYVIDINSKKGIPTHYDPSGGWKGDRTYGWGIKFPYDDEVLRRGWVKDAYQLVVTNIMQQRIKTGFTKPQEQED